MKKILLISALLLVLMPAFVSAVYTLPANRTIDWSKAGVSGGIPNRQTICATLSPSGSDDSTAIQNAINNCQAGQVVYLNAGTYIVNKIVTINKNITLRGAGPSKTILMLGMSGKNGILLGGNYARSSPIAVTALARGSNSITVADASSIKVGSLLLLDQKNEQSVTEVSPNGEGGIPCTWCNEYDTSDGGGNRAVGQLVRVAAKSGNTLTLEKAVYWPYVLSASPHVLILTGAVNGAGIEDLQLTQSNSYPVDHLLDILGCSNCWVKNCELKNGKLRHLEVAVSYQFEIRDSLFHLADHYGQDHGYCLSLWDGATDGLIENNIFDTCVTAVPTSGPVTGNVIAYNYVNYIEYTNDGRMLQGDMATHGAHASFNLYEGNLAKKMLFDNFWGSASHGVLFRNHFAAWETGKDQNLHAVQIDAQSTYVSVIGNVLGSSQANYVRYETNAITADCYSQADIYKLGYFYGTGACSASDNDPKVKATLLRHGNYDYYNKAVLWDPSISDHTLPSSLYLTSKPAWWGNLPWPAVGPDLSPMIGKIPAQVRWEAMSSGTTCASLGGSCCSSGQACSGSIQPSSDCSSCCVGGTCTASSCTSQCTNGSRQCSGNSVQTCGNYDTDSCFEWGGTTACNSTQTCSAGVCQTISSAIPGDVDGDGKVDISDLGFIGLSFGMRTGDAGFNSIYDVDANGMIDIADLSFVARRSSGLISSCTSDCTSGARRCSGNSVQTCGNYDTDSCFEWGNTANCTSSQTCSNGACVATEGTQPTGTPKFVRVAGIIRTYDAPVVLDGTTYTPEFGQGVVTISGVQAGNTLVVITSLSATQTTTVTSNTGENWINDVHSTYPATPGDSINIFHASDVSGGSKTIIITSPQTTRSLRALVLEYSGLASNSQVLTSSGYGYDGSTYRNALTTGSAGSVTTTIPNSLILVTCRTDSDFLGWSPGPGYTMRDNPNSGEEPEQKVGVEDMIATTPGRYSGTFTFTSDLWACGMAAFAPSGSSVGSLPSCTNDCTTSGSRQCSDSSHYQVCGNYDSDSCFEWSSTTTACTSGQTCSGGVCSATCADECSSGSRQCSDSSHYQVCGNYDSDSCLELSTATACASGTACSGGSCISSGGSTGNALAVDAYLSFEGSVTGGAYYATSGSLVHDASSLSMGTTTGVHALRGPVSVRGVTYSGASTQALRISNDIPDTVTMHLGMNCPVVSYGGFITIGQLTGSFVQIDYLGIDNGWNDAHPSWQASPQILLGSYSEKQCLSMPCIQIEASVNGETVRSTGKIDVQPGKTYWFTQMFDTPNRITYLSLYDPDNNYARVGEISVTCDGLNANGDLRVILGWTSPKDQDPQNTFNYLDNFIVDCTNHRYPLIPG